MAEPVAAWWARRQRSRGLEVPYPVGTYREQWRPYPVLVRQYHADLNGGVALSQIPPAAEVLLQWQCDVGHLFVATPAEQRGRPGGTAQRRRSVWCPECATGAAPPRVRGAQTAEQRHATLQRLAARPRAPRRLCPRTPDLPVGESFASSCAPAIGSAVEARLHLALAERFAFTTGHTAVRLREPFHDHLEAWPDVVIPELRVALEYDTAGRHGLEHVGRREASDRRKDRLLRRAGWEVVRLRASPLRALGPHDLEIGSLGPRALDRLDQRLAELRGALFLDAYRR
ncbi:MAG: hypothetical protein J0G30_07340 [Actinomycetales bacterium]|nr:hypothetical protein [Actinomycetales bacterium]